MERLSGNSRVLYEQLRAMGGGRVSLGTLACLCGCHRNTVKRLVHQLAARGLINLESGARGRPNRYEVP